MRGDRLKRLRDEKGYTQKEFAALIGSSPRMITRYENNESDPTAYQLGEMAKALEVTTDYLIGTSDDPIPVRSEELSELELRLLRALRAGDTTEGLQMMLAVLKAGGGESGSGTKLKPLHK